MFVYVYGIALRLTIQRWITRSGTGGRLLSISGPTVVPVTDVSSLVTGSPATTVLLDIILATTTGYYWLLANTTTGYYWLLANTTTGYWLMLLLATG